MPLFFILLSALAFPLLMAAATTPTIAEAQAFMDRAEAELLKIGVPQQRGWIQETYITDDSELLAASENERVIARTTELINEGKRFEALNLPPDLKRKFLLMKLSLTMPAPKDAKLREELTQVAASLDGSYGKGKYCPGGDKEPCFGIDDLDERLAKSRDPKEIADLWTGWHKIGALMRERYARFVDLLKPVRANWDSPTPACSGARVTTCPPNSFPPSWSGSGKRSSLFITSCTPTFAAS